MNPGNKLKISILAWDVCHNAVGRAYMLAEMLSRIYSVEIVGARFPRYGGSIWPPIRNGTIKLTSFAGTDFPTHFSRMREMANNIDGDVLLVSKPRLPSVELAALARINRARPAFIDVDDYEPAFFEEAPLPDFSAVRKMANEPDFKVPYGALWTRYTEHLIPAFDAVTVSGIQLLEKFRGELIPHARDERRFDPALYDRAEIRKRLGFSPTDKVVLFIGTPRSHKGILDVLAALKCIGNADYKLCVIGNITDRKLLVGLLKGPAGMVRLLPSQPFHDLPANLAAGDLVCLLQDQHSRVARYQTPAKFTDALAMGIPVIASPVPPMIAAAENSLVNLTGDRPLHEIIDSIFKDLPSHRESALRNRDVFLSDYSYGAVLPRLVKVIERLKQSPATKSTDLDRLISYHRECFGPASQKKTVPGKTDARSRAGQRGHVKKTLDIVFFWKQNDSGIYGRRQDMIVKHLARSERVGRIVHFDAPASMPRLAWSSLTASRVDHSNLVLKNTIARVAGFGHEGKVRNHSYVFFIGKRILKHLPPITRRFIAGDEGFTKYVERKLSLAGVSPSEAVFYNCPLNFYFPEIHDYFRPAVTVTDMIDDQRTFYSLTSAKFGEITKNYSEILSRSDIVLANCPKLVETVKELGGHAHLVPNGVDLEDEADFMEIPPDLARIPTPRIGYVGNLSSRIDVSLLAYLALRRPDWNLVLIGSAHLNKRILELDRHRNIHFLGVRTYPDVRRYIRFFDVAIIPHEKNAMTDSMHPLKLLVYAALKVPIVSTDIENLGDFRGIIRIGKEPENFCTAVEQALNDQTRKTKKDAFDNLLRENSWSARASEILELIDEKLPNHLTN